MEDKIKAVISAWLVGETIQFYDENKGWVDWRFGEYSQLSPMTKPKQGWRVKPTDPWADSVEEIKKECQAAYIEGWQDAETYWGIKK